MKQAATVQIWEWRLCMVICSARFQRLILVLSPQNTDDFVLSLMLSRTALFLLAVAEAHFTSSAMLPMRINLYCIAGAPFPMQEANFVR